MLCSLHTYNITNIIDKNIAPDHLLIWGGENQVTSFENHGLYIRVNDEYETPLIPDDNSCVYINYDKKGVAPCGIEEAYNQGEIT